MLASPDRTVLFLFWRLCRKPTPQIPLAGLLLVRRFDTKKQLDERVVIARYGFLFFAYRPEFAWWESVVMCRKILVVVRPFSCPLLFISLSRSS